MKLNSYIWMPHKTSTTLSREENIVENKKYEDTLKSIKQYIKDRLRKSFEYEWGISDNRSDRLFTETIIELQLIDHMIDECFDTYGYKREVCESNER